jgi:hypothetical protein
MQASTSRHPIRHAVGAAAFRALPAYWWLSGTRIVLNSVPKCGTHLLKHLLLVAGLPFSTEQVIVNDAGTAAVLDDLLRRTRGQGVVGHLIESEEYRRIAEKRGARVFFITRDPRDQVVSHVFHYRTHTDHALHPYFRDRVPDLDDALFAGIRGFGPGPDGHLADVSTFFHYFLGWKDVPETCAMTFEDLVGPLGGGSAERQLACVRTVLRHAGFPLRNAAAARFIAARVFSRQSPTFRAGRIGGWREYFKPAHVEAFKEVAGQLLIDLGYERDFSW